MTKHQNNLKQKIRNLIETLASAHKNELTEIFSSLYAIHHKLVENNFEIDIQAYQKDLDDKIKKFPNLNGFQNQIDEIIKDAVPINFYNAIMALEEQAAVIKDTKLKKRVDILMYMAHEFKNFGSIKDIPALSNALWCTVDIIRSVEIIENKGIGFSAEEKSKEYSKLEKKYDELKIALQNCKPSLARRVIAQVMIIWSYALGILGQDLLRSGAAQTLKPFRESLSCVIDHLLHNPRPDNASEANPPSPELQVEIKPVTGNTEPSLPKAPNTPQEQNPYFNLPMPI